MCLGRHSTLDYYLRQFELYTDLTFVLYSAVIIVQVIVLFVGLFLIHFFDTHSNMLAPFVMHLRPWISLPNSFFKTSFSLILIGFVRQEFEFSLITQFHLRMRCSWYLSLVLHTPVAISDTYLLKWRIITPVLHVTLCSIGLFRIENFELVVL